LALICSTLDPARGAYSTPPDLQGGLFVRVHVTGRVGKGMEGRGGEGNIVEVGIEVRGGKGTNRTNFDSVAPSMNASVI